MRVREADGLAGSGHDLVAGGAQRGGQDGADPTGAHNPDSGHRTHRLSFQSHAGYRTTQ